MLLPVSLHGTATGIKKEALCSRAALRKLAELLLLFFLPVRLVCFEIQRISRQLLYYLPSPLLAPNRRLAREERLRGVKHFVSVSLQVSEKKEESGSFRDSISVINQTSADADTFLPTAEPGNY